MFLVLRAIAALMLTVATAANAYQEVPVKGGGAVAGRVAFLGRPPTLRRFPVTKDPQVCGSSREDDAFQVAKDGSVENVVVYLLEVKSGKSWGDDLLPVLDQKGCHYLPHVQVVRQNATLQIKSSDPVLHNIHSFLNGSTVLNVAVPPKKGLLLKHRLDKAGGMQLKCDVHSFMRGGIFVATNPYYALTAADGHYRIADIPPGQYLIATWHEEAGPVNEAITVSGGATVVWNPKVR